VTTSELTKAFGWDEQDVRAQQDAMEFYTELFRHLEAFFFSSAAM
jgi:hypothetical protein